ncbi:unnamed protein product [Choristocarpus tenellus]
MVALPEPARWLGRALISASLAAGALGIDPVFAAISNSEICISGTGTGCDSAAGGSDLIKTLQARSAENREKNERETLDKYNQHNYKDYFKTLNMRMVRHKDGKYDLLTESEYSKAEREGRVWADSYVE